MISLAGAIFISSLLGSVHCIAMCGPLVGLHAGAGSLRLAVVHSLGRLATYATLGAAAGGVGHALDLAGDLGTVQRAASLVAGVAIVVWGAWSLATARGIDIPGKGTWFRSGLVQIRSRRATARAWLIGVLTGLLPCGWLWAFVVTAAGTGSPVDGIATMTAFWLGTVPAMLGVLALAGPLLDRVRSRIPAISAVFLIALGLGTLAVRWRDAGEAQVAHPHCHCHEAR
jgi:sulfite exporter TauE/SafE